MTRELTTAQLAAELGVSTQRVHALARSRGQLDRLSRKVGNTRLWRPIAVQRLAPGPVGNPGRSRKNAP